MPGGAVRIDVDKDGNPWVVNDSHGIFQWKDKKWHQKSGAAWDIGVGPTNEIWVIGTGAEKGGYSIYNWKHKNKEWKKVDGSAVRIAVGPTGPWIVTNKGAIYQRLDKKWH